MSNNLGKYKNIKIKIIKSNECRGDFDNNVNDEIETLEYKKRIILDLQISQSIMSSGQILTTAPITHGILRN